MTTPITDTRTEQVSRMVVQYEKDMLMLCFVYLRNMDLAQEALQESFLKAYTRFDTFRGASSEKTWLTRIVINTCKDIRRTAWFRHRSLEISAELPGAVLPPDETHIDLMDAILKLPLQSREVILLKYDQGLNNEEIARVLGLTPMAVSKRLRKAYSLMRNTLEGGTNQNE